MPHIHPTQPEPVNPPPSTRRISADQYLKNTPLADRAAALDPDDRRERDLIIELYDYGYRIAVRCTSCGAWLAAPKSVARHQGPVCAKRAGDAA